MIMQTHCNRKPEKTRVPSLVIAMTLFGVAILQGCTRRNAMDLSRYPSGDRPTSSVLTKDDTDVMAPPNARNEALSITTEASSAPPHGQNSSASAKPKGSWHPLTVTLDDPLSPEKLLGSGFQKEPNTQQYTRIMNVGDLKATLGLSSKDLRRAPGGNEIEPTYIVLADGWVVLVRIMPQKNEEGGWLPSGKIADAETKISVSVAKRRSGLQ